MDFARKPARLLEPPAPYLSRPSHLQPCSARPAAHTQVHAPQPKRPPDAPCLAAVPARAATVSPPSRVDRTTTQRARPPLYPTAAGFVQCAPWLRAARRAFPDTPVQVHSESPSLISTTPAARLSLSLRRRYTRSAGPPHFPVLAAPTHPRTAADMYQAKTYPPTPSPRRS
ncbi:hypothetical protein HYPSUDRAFT_200128 [Hypholoma sublateritium FD-334 SS-4]|uniref:Uncharacterized protein n=1 Tax=Hypholoma sublateritium (strain FD-334 SS-4) TaxID=945553 RepID=A0A0D2P882_HYPSF|nr:hypothetical protein HYPSUDRAFT_200128 [Hypholoma sublateritium FD-334 SS-4]